MASDGSYRKKHHHLECDIVVPDPSPLRAYLIAVAT